MFGVLGLLIGVSLYSQHFLQIFLPGRSDLGALTQDNVRSYLPWVSSQSLVITPPCLQALSVSPESLLNHVLRPGDTGRPDWFYCFSTL